jgi:hypothetical protein
MPRKNGLLYRGKLISQGGRCFYCATLLNEAQWHTKPTFDHVRPRAHGGTNAPENLVLACLPCNSAKGSMSAAEFTPRAARLRARIIQAVERKSSRKNQRRRFREGLAAKLGDIFGSQPTPGEVSSTISLLQRLRRAKRRDMQALDRLLRAYADMPVDASADMLRAWADEVVQTLLILRPPSDGRPETKEWRSEMSGLHRCAAREVEQRRAVYPRLIEQGRMTEATAGQEIANMQKVRAWMRRLSEATPGQVMGVNVLVLTKDPKVEAYVWGKLSGHYTFADLSRDA